MWVLYNPPEHKNKHFTMNFTMIMIQFIALKDVLSVMMMLQSILVFTVIENSHLYVWTILTSNQ